MPNRHPIHLHKLRIETLTDGLFAIVLTLLVLELKVPELTRAEAMQHLNAHLLQQLPVFIGFVITFMVGGMFWYLHHLSFHFISHTSPRLVVANLVFLGFVALLPFTMALYSRYQGLMTPAACYFGNFLGIALGLNLHWFVARRDGLLNASQLGVEQAALTRRIGRFIVASSVGLIVAFVKPDAAMIFFFAIMLSFRAIERLRVAKT
jgi:uncharacterized membrane protein